MLCFASKRALYMHFVYTEPVFFKDVENYVKVKLKSLHLRRYNSQFRIIKTSFHTFHRVFNTEKFFCFTGLFMQEEAIFA